MPFINEKIPEEFFKFFDFSTFKCFDGKTPMAIGPYLSWTRDKERDAFLVVTDAGGGPHVDAPRMVKFGLWWKGDVIHFVGNPTDSRDNECQILTCENPRVSIPPELVPRRAEFLQILGEALIAKGEFINNVVPKNSTKVFVNLA